MTDWNKSWLTLRYRWKTVLGWSLAATLGLTTLVYADAHAPHTEADIPYMMQTLDDAAEGCRVFLNPAVPGGYMTGRRHRRSVRVERPVVFGPNTLLH